jgi:hypothetical protein
MNKSIKIYDKYGGGIQQSIYAIYFELNIHNPSSKSYNWYYILKIFLVINNFFKTCYHFYFSSKYQYSHQYSLINLHS